MHIMQHGNPIQKDLYHITLQLNVMNPNYKPLYFISNLCNILALEMANFRLRTMCPQLLQLQFPAV